MQRRISLARAALGTTALLILAACASSEEKAPTYASPQDDPRVGEEVNRVCFTRSISGFSEWNRGEGLILRTQRQERFLATFIGPCFPADSALRIGFPNQFGGCLSRGDDLIVSSRIFPSRRDTAFDTDRCRINKIYAYDGPPDAEEQRNDGAMPTEADISDE